MKDHIMESYMACDGQWFDGLPEFAPSSLQRGGLS